MFCDEITLADDDSGKIPYLIGEISIYQDIETTQDCLEKAKTGKVKEIEELKKKGTDVQSLMTDLKSHLYGKFGSHISILKQMKNENDY